MTTRYFSLILGIVFVVAGIAGFIPGLLTPPHATDPALALEGGYGRLFGLFPVNWVHNLIHIAFGIAGLVCYRSFGAARSYAQATAVIYGVLIVFGFIPLLNTTFGLAPLFGHDIWLHFLIAAPAAYFGFVHAERREAVAGR